jgi:hypothetical protein
VIGGKVVDSSALAAYARGSVAMDAWLAVAAQVGIVLYLPGWLCYVGGKQTKFSAVLARSDSAGEFGKDRCEPRPSVDIYAEFVVAATEVLDERVPGTDHPCGAQLFQAAHRP